MLTLLSQIILSLLAAAALGWWLGQWWVKRQYEDVTVSYDDMLS